MAQDNDLNKLWIALPEGAQAALEEQWAGIAASGLPCGASIVDADGQVIATGRNHTFDPPNADTREQYPLQYNRLAHAELNALAKVPTDTDHNTLTLWSTQHPCSMCAAAIAFIGVGTVQYIADDLSDDSAPQAVAATHQGVFYKRLGDRFWWTISNLLFLYTSALLYGSESRNLKMNIQRYPDLIQLTLNLAKNDSLGNLARSEVTLPDALDHYVNEITHATRYSP